MRENNYYHVDKKARFEVEQEEMVQQQQYQDPRGQDPQFQALLHQQRLIRQLQQQQQQQLRQQLQQQQGAQQIIPPSERPFEAGVCARKLMMYLYHLQQRPSENCITYWRKFVAEYFSPRAKQRLCLSQYRKGMFPPAASDVWQCSLCGTKSGKGVEATYDVLARLFEVKFSSGIVDELLSLDYPREYRVSNGLMVLEYRKAVQQTVYEKFRVVHEGPLRIIFSQDLKILSWEFCARRHEEFLVRRVIAPQVNQLLQVTQKCQSTISESGSEGVSQHDLQTNSDMVLGEGRKLAKFVELESLNEHGYPKKYVRALQVHEVFKSMKDLMDFTYEHKIGPIEGLKRLSEQTATMQEMGQFGSNEAMNGSAQAQMNGLAGNNNSNNHRQDVGRGAMNDSAQAAASLSNNQSMFMSQRQTPYSNQSPYLYQQRQNLGTGGSPSSPQMQQQQRTMHGTPNTLQQTRSQHDLDQELQQMFENLPNLQKKQQQKQAFSGGRVTSRRNKRSKTASNNNPHLSEDATERRDDFSDDNFFNNTDK